MPTARVVYSSVYSFMKYILYSEKSNPMLKKLMGFSLILGSLFLKTQYTGV